MTVHLISADRALLEKIAEQVDVAETYHISVRRPGYVTERHANIEAHPEGNEYAYPCDEIALKHRSLLVNELVKEGAQSDVSDKFENVLEGSKSEQIEFGGKTLLWSEKDSSWNPETEEKL